MASELRAPKGDGGHPLRVSVDKAGNTGIWSPPVPPTQFCCESKTDLKTKVSKTRVSISKRKTGEEMPVPDQGLCATLQLREQLKPLESLVP